MGGTKVETALVEATGHILASHRRPTHPGKGSDGVIADIVACVESCLGKVTSSAQSLGVGMAGQIDKDTGVVRFAPNLGWRNVSLWARLESLEQPPGRFTGFRRLKKNQGAEDGYVNIRGTLY